MIRGQERPLRPNRPADLAERPQSAQPRRPRCSGEGRLSTHLQYPG